MYVFHAPPSQLITSVRVSKRHQRKQNGFSLIIVLLILVVVSILGVGGIQISMMAERSTRNDRDLQVAWQSAEAGLIDAELDIQGQPAGATTKRNEVFDRKATDLAKFIAGCGKSGEGKSFGLCAPLTTPDIKPDWLTVNFTETGNDANTVGFGKFTGRVFPAGGAGLQPAAVPRYVIEIIDDTRSARTRPPGSPKDYIYRVTALGFGPNVNTQAVVQMIYRN
ncbi:MAG: pilus assembly protein [Burkholderiaceae bacterium]|nr:pilus assembly protein [Burkholderiaceae bacterium]